MEPSKATQIELAIAHLNRQKTPNYAATARAYGVQRTTLWRRHKGLNESHAVASSKHRKNLTEVEEKELLRYINAMTDRQIPPTTQIIINLAEELLHGPVEKNWTARFIKRHSEYIFSYYLCFLDHVYVSAENTAVFEHFYSLVLLFFCFFVTFLLIFS